MVINFLDNLNYMQTITKRIEVTKTNIGKILDKNLKASGNTIQKSIELFGIPMKVEQQHGERITLESIITRKCNAKCSFCISEMAGTPKKELNNDDYILFTENVIKEFKKNSNLNFDMRVSGGEPLLFFDRLKRILKTLEKNYVNAYRVNTNGSMLKDSKYVEMLQHYSKNQPFNLDVSRHHFNDERNNELFKRKIISSDELAEVNQKLNGNIILRSLIMDGYIDSVEKIKKFIDHFHKKGFNIFSFKSLNDSLNNPSETNLEHLFVKDHQIDYFNVVNEVAKDKEFNFKNQIFSNEGISELYEYDGVPIKFSYFTTDRIRKLEDIERANGKKILRTGVINPDGKFVLGWDDTKNTIFNFDQNH